MAAQQLADGHCEDAPKLDTVSGLVSKLLLSVSKPFGFLLSSGSKDFQAS